MTALRPLAAPSALNPVRTAVENRLSLSVLKRQAESDHKRPVSWNRKMKQESDLN